MASWAVPVSRYGQNELEYCREALRKDLRKCEGNEFLRVSCAISLLLNCAESLHITQLNAAMAHFLCDGQGHYFEEEHDALCRVDWIHKFDLTFREDQSRFVTFALPAMPYLLRCSRLQGVDASHRTIALLCLTQVEVDYEHQCRGSFVPGARSAFSPYAAQYFRAHARVAEKSSLMLRPFRVRKSGSQAGSGRNALASKRANLDDHTHGLDSVYLKLESFDIEDENGDYVWIGKHEQEDSNSCVCDSFDRLRKWDL